MKKKLYLVKKEVFANSIKEALTAPGKVYEIAEADERFQPSENQQIGFNVKKK